MQNLWTEVYRPTVVDEYVFVDEAQRTQVMHWVKSKSIPHILLSGSAGVGKAQPLSANVLTPTGWVTMGDIESGDQIVAADGKTCDVLATFPQGKKDIYEIKFNDGRVVEACYDHLWQVWDHGSQKWRVMTTKDIDSKLLSTKKKFYIPLRVEAAERVDLPIDPYVLGALLGDGCLRKHSFGFCTSDEEMIDILSPLLEPGYELVRKPQTKYDYRLRRVVDNRDDKMVASRENIFRNVYKKKIFDLQLLDTTSKTKFIPDIYKFGSLAQKEQLLAGLIDTDGYVSTNGAISISSSSQQLANDVVDVVRSIGGIAKITTKMTTYAYKGVKKAGAINYNVAIRYRIPSNLSVLSRKKSRISLDYQYKNLKLRIDSITFKEKAEAQCILIDHPSHLYVTDNYVVTHNTTLAKILIKALGVDEYDVLEINASRENSVEDIRTRITNFVSTMPFGEFKIVLLDEADFLSPNAQAALRGVMESYNQTARFILTCNYPHKIIPALHSRCQSSHIDKIDRTEFTARVATVLVTENVDFDLDTLDNYVAATYPDLRKCLNLLQMNSSTGTLAKPSESDKSEADYKSQMVELFKAGKIREARTLICAQARVDEMEDIYRWAYDNLNMWSDNDEGQDAAILVIRKGLVNHSLCADAEINLSATLTELSQIGQ